MMKQLQMMGRKQSSRSSVSKDKSFVEDEPTTVSDASERPQEQAGRMSLFHRLFAPDTMETDVSEDSQFDSLGSASQYTDMSGSIDEYEESDANDESTAESSQTSTLVKFDRDLRARHRAACKNMTVRKTDSVCGGNSAAHQSCALTLFLFKCRTENTPRRSRRLKAFYQRY